MQEEKANKVQKVSIAHSIKNIRNKAGLTLDQLTEKVSFSRRMLSGYESGENVPPVDKFIEIAISCDMSPFDVASFLTGIPPKSNFKMTKSEELIATQRQALVFATEKIGILEHELDEYRKEKSREG